MSSGYTDRTRRNIQDSDGTVILSFASTLTGGSKQTLDVAHRIGKPVQHFVISRDHAAMGELIMSWLAKYRIATLNVAGPRESKEPGINHFSRYVLVEALDELISPR